MFQDRARGHKITKSVIAHDLALGEYDEGGCLKIVHLNFIKFSVKFELIASFLPERPYNSETL